MEKAILSAVIIAAASFVLQKTLGNIFYGLMVFLVHPCKKGDKVTIRQGLAVIASGNVIGINLLHIKIKEYNRDVCIVPNSLLESCVIVNADYKDGVNYTSHIKVSFDSDLVAAKDAIRQAVINHTATYNTEENTHVICKPDNGGMILEYNIRTADVNASYDATGEITMSIARTLSSLPNITLV